MSAPRTVGLLFLIVATGCTGEGSAARGGQSDAAQGRTRAVEPWPEPTQPATTPGSKGQSVTKADPPRTKAPAKIAASPIPTDQPRKNEVATPAAKKPVAPPPLDVASLKTRLRETNAIGVLSKLALKNQVDDLLDQFRAAYRGGQKTTPVALRQPYDMLVMKVLALLQDSDPALARPSPASPRGKIRGLPFPPKKAPSPPSPGPLGFTH